MDVQCNNMLSDNGHKTSRAAVRQSGGALTLAAAFSPRAPPVLISLAVQGVRLGPRRAAFASPEKTLRPAPFVTANRQVAALAQVLSSSRERSAQTLGGSVQRSTTYDNSFTISTVTSHVCSQLASNENDPLRNQVESKETTQLLFDTDEEREVSCLTSPTGNLKKDSWPNHESEGDVEQLVSDCENSINTTTVDSADEDVTWLKTGGAEEFHDEKLMTEETIEMEAKIQSGVRSVRAHDDQQTVKKKFKRKKAKRKKKQREAKSSRFQESASNLLRGKQTRAQVADSTPEVKLNSHCSSKAMCLGNHQRLSAEKKAKSKRQISLSSLSTPNLLTVSSSLSGSLRPALKNTAFTTESSTLKRGCEDKSAGKEVERNFVLPAVGNGSHFPSAYHETTESRPNTTHRRQVVFLSQAQSTFLSSQGISAAPPSTPTQDQSDKDVILSLADAMAQQTLKARVSVLAKRVREASAQEEKKSLDESKRQEREEEQRERERLKSRQRAEIYVLNRIMAQLEQNQFEAFCQLQAERKVHDCEYLQSSTSIHQLGV